MGEYDTDSLAYVKRIKCALVRIGKRITWFSATLYPDQQQIYRLAASSIYGFICILKWRIAFFLLVYSFAHFFTLYFAMLKMKEIYWNIYWHCILYIFCQMTVIQKKCFLRQSFKKDPFYILNSAEFLEISNVFIGIRKISFTGWESLKIIFEMRNKDKKKIFQRNQFENKNIFWLAPKTLDTFSEACWASKVFKILKYLKRCATFFRVC